MLLHDSSANFGYPVFLCLHHRVAHNCCVFARVFPAIRKNTFPEITSICHTKKYGKRNCICSITTCLFRSKTKWYTMKQILVLHRIPQYCLKIMYQCWILFPSRKNQSVLIAKISSHKTQEIVNPQKYTPAKISCHKVVFRPFESTVAHCKYDF